MVTEDYKEIVFGKWMMIKATHGKTVVTAFLIAVLEKSVWDY